MPLVVNHLFEFGEFRLNPKEKMLLRRNETVPLTPKIFELLALFVENHGRLIEKDEIMERIWADSFVEESNLTFSIRQLRKILDDNAQTPTYIETVRGHGYRFIAPVKEIDVPDNNIENDFSEIIIEKNITFEPIEKTSDLPAKFVERKPSQSYLPVAAFVIFLITLLAVALIWSRNRTDSTTTAPILETEFKSEALTNAGGVYEAVISPDGKLMAYSSGIGGKTGIWIKRLQTGENFQIIPNSDDAYYGLTFSNDNQQIYFSRGPRTNEMRTINIYRVSILGGIPQEIINNVHSLFSLSPDDRQISFTRCPRTDEDFCSLFVADIDGKNEKKLLTLPRPVQIRDNQFSPDGKSIAVAVGETRSSSSRFGLIEVDAQTGAKRDITNHKFSSIQYLRWLPDKSSILVTAFEPPNNSVKIFQVSTTTDEIKNLTKDSSITYGCISLDKEGKRMVTTQITSNYQVWTAPITEPTSAQAISQATDPMYLGQSLFTFSPSGKKILFASAADINQQIWIMNPDGTDQRQLTTGQGTNWQPRFAPNESYILFTSNRTGSAQIWRMNLDGSNQTQLTNEETGSRPIFISADGKSIYYESPFDQILKKMTIDADGKGNSSPVSSERIFQPEINRDETTVAYFSRPPKQPFQIALMSLADGKILKTFPLAEESNFPRKVIWSADGKSLFYLGKNGAVNKVWQISLETGKTEIFANLGENEVADIAVSPDGESFTFVRGRSLHDAFLLTGLK